MTKQAVTETIRICRDRNILKQYLSSREVEAVTFPELLESVTQKKLNQRLCS